MSDIFADNVTKFQSGALGSSKIETGYIKAVENIWLDSYTIAFTSTKTTLDIAVLGPGRKITDVLVMIETSVSQTNGTIGIGFSEDANHGILYGPNAIGHNQTISTISMTDILIGGSVGSFRTVKINAFQKVTSGTQTTITLQFNNWTMTTGTVKTLVRYT